MKNVGYGCFLCLTFIKKCTYIQIKWIKVDKHGEKCLEEAPYIPLT